MSYDSLDHRNVLVISVSCVIVLVALVWGALIATAQDRHRHSIQNQACIAAGKQVVNDNCIESGATVITQ